MIGRRVIAVAWSLVLCGLVLAPAAPATAASTDSPSVSSTNLIEHPRQYDGQQITFQGEVIGEALARGDYAWLTINDDTYQHRSAEEGHKLEGYNSGQAVWLPTDQIAGITHYGKYFEAGDIVKVTGVFNRACAVHGGDMDIHADMLQVVARGHDTPHPFQTGKASVAAIMIAIALTMGMFIRQIRRHPPTDYSVTTRPPARRT